MYPSFMRIRLFVQPIVSVYMHLISVAEFNVGLFLTGPTGYSNRLLLATFGLRRGDDIYLDGQPS